MDNFQVRPQARNPNQGPQSGDDVAYITHPGNG
jgi:hypothetical protein